MKVRFQADANLNEIIVKATLRREPTIEFQTALDVNLSGLEDEDVLAIAAKRGMLLVTHDRKTIPRHFGEFIKSKDCPGVLIVPQKFTSGQSCGRPDFNMDSYRGGRMDK
jgi:hypothetical protein